MRLGEWARHDQAHVFPCAYCNNITFYLVGAYICPISHMYKCAKIPLREPWRLGSRSAIINGDPGATRVKCLAQGHIGRFFTLVAQRFKLETLTARLPAALPCVHACLTTNYHTDWGMNLTAADIKMLASLREASYVSVEWSHHSFP
jgi:hypothetical protein